MKLNEFYSVADAIAPKALSDEFCAKWHGYDNSGILVNAGKEITSAIFSLDLSNAVIEKAMSYHVPLIVTHHPAIYGGISQIDVESFSPLGDKLIKCIENGISVVSMHLNLDCAIGGTDDMLKEGIVKASGGDASGTLAVCNPLSVGGYGKVYNVQGISLGQLAQNMEKEFFTKRVLVYGNAGRKIQRVASFCGAGGDEKAVAFAVQNGADVIVSSDFKHHVLTLANEKGLAVIALTHYASENYGFEKYYKKIRRQVGVPCLYHTDEELL